MLLANTSISTVIVNIAGQSLPYHGAAEQWSKYSAGNPGSLGFSAIKRGSEVIKLWCIKI